MRQVPKKHTVDMFHQKKQRAEPIKIVTCYDYPSAQMVALTDIDCILVGDSVSMVMHGYDSTIHADIAMMKLHVESVSKGIGHQFLIVDIPFLDHRMGVAHLLNQAKVLMKAGAQAVKIEGGDEVCCEGIRALSLAGIPVVGHLGLTPQSVHGLGGYRVQGKSLPQAEKIKQQAKDLEQAGCVALVLECIPEALAEEISNTLMIATIGIGAGKGTNGQVLVWHDLLGLQDTLVPRFVKQFAQTKSMMVEALKQYTKAVEERSFPDKSHSYS